MKTIIGDLLDISPGILCHQVNCQRKMGAGLALQVKRRFPQVYDAYQKQPPYPGRCLMVEIHHNKWMANLYGQVGVGDELFRDTHYGYLARAMAEVQQWRDMRFSEYAEHYLPVYIPWHMGCGLAGGDWSIVQELITGLLPDATIVQRKEDQ